MNKPALKPERMPVRCRASRCSRMPDNFMSDWPQVCSANTWPESLSSVGPTREDNWQKAAVLIKKAAWVACDANKCRVNPVNITITGQNCANSVTAAIAGARWNRLPGRLMKVSLPLAPWNRNTRLLCEICQRGMSCKRNPVFFDVVYAESSLKFGKLQGCCLAEEKPQKCLVNN